MAPLTSTDEEILTEELIDSVKTIGQAIKLLEKNKLDEFIKDIKEVKEAKYLLRQKLKEDNGIPTRKPLDIAESQQLGERVIKYFDEAEKILGKYSFDVFSPSDDLIDIDKEIKARKEEAKFGKCKVLIAGETSSGKSSFLNLLIGEDILPISVLSCTSVLCEIKYGERKELKAYSSSSDSFCEILNLSHEKNISSAVEEYIKQDGDRKKEFKWKKIEIYWPLKALQGGLSFIDSPGIGESKIMDEMSTFDSEYLSDVNGIIYMVASNNAGGVNGDRLGKLLHKWTSKTERGASFEADAMFVCNKWDQVQVKDIKEVKKGTYDKLKHYYDKIEESQIFYMNTAKALKWCKNGHTTEELDELTNGLEIFIQRIFLRKSRYFLRRLQDLLTNGMKNLYSSIVSRSDHQRKNYEKIQNYLQVFSQHDENEKKRIQSLISENSEEIVSHLKEHFQKSKTQSILGEWKVEQAPVVENYEDLVKKTEDAVKKKIDEEVLEWQKKNINDIKKKLFRDIFKNDDLKEIENYFFEPDTGVEKITDNPLTDNLSKDDDLSSTKLVLLSLSAPLWVPVGIVGGVLTLPIFGYRTLADFLKKKKQLNDYNKNKEGFLKQLTEQMITEYLISNIQSFQKHIMKGLSDEVNIILTKKISPILDRKLQSINAQYDELEKKKKDLLEPFLERILSKIKEINELLKENNEISSSSIHLDTSKPEAEEGICGRGRLIYAEAQNFTSFSVQSEDSDSYLEPSDIQLNIIPDNSANNISSKMKKLCDETCETVTDQSKTTKTPTRKMNLHDNINKEDQFDDQNKDESTIRHDEETISRLVKETLTEEENVNDPIALIRRYQNKFLAGRKLDVSDSERAQGDSDVFEITVSRLNLFITSMEELMAHLPDIPVRYPLNVDFMGEYAQDFGGPRKEFLRLILQEIKDRLFEPDPENNDRYILLSNKNYLEKNYYEAAGIFCSLSILELGPFPTFFSNKVIDDLFDNSAESKIKCMHQFKKGWRKVGFTELFKEKPYLKTLFRPTGQLLLSVSRLKKILIPNFSDNGTSKRKQEEHIYGIYMKYLREVDAGRRGCVTLNKILRFGTGAEREPLLDFEVQPSIHFIPKDVFLLTANTCVNRIDLPIPHLGQLGGFPPKEKIFENFDECFVQEYFGCK